MKNVIEMAPDDVLKHSTFKSEPLFWHVQAFGPPVCLCNFMSKLF